MAQTDQLVIELIADTSKFQPAIDQLEKIGAVDKTTADLIRKTNQELDQRAKSLSTVNAQSDKATKGAQTMAAGFEKAGKQLDNVSKNLAGGATSSALNTFIQKVQEAFNKTGQVAQVTAQDVKETGLSFEELGKILNTTFSNQKGVENVRGHVVSLRTELRQLKQDLASGTLPEEEFQKAVKRAAELEDAISDVNLQVRNLASDTRSLDGSVQAIQGVTGAFQVAEGSAALFGFRLEDMQEVQLRLVALLNISNGLQQIQNLLQKESAAIQLITNTQLKLKNALTVVENGLESKSVIIRVAATVAQRALNAAMAANPAGLLVAALGALAGALLIFSNHADTAAESQKKLNEEQAESLTLLKQLEATFAAQEEIKIKALETELALARARGASAIELAKIEVQIADAKKDAAITSAAFFENERNSIEALNDDYREQLQVIKNLKDERRAGNEDLDAEIESAEILLGTINDRINLERSLRDNIANSTKEQLVARENLTQAEREEARKRIEELEKQKQREKELLLQRLEDEKAVIQTHLIEVEKGTQQEEGLKAALIQKQAQIDLLSLEGTKNTEAQRLLIIARANDEVRQLKLENEREIIEQTFALQEKLNTSDQNRIEAGLASTEQGSAQQLELHKQLLEAQADADKLAAQRTFELSEKNVADQKVFSTEIQKIDAETNQAKADADKAYYDQLEELRQQDLDRQRAAIKQYTDMAIQVATAITQFRTDLEMQEIQNTLDAKLEAIERERDAELANKKLSTKERQDIEEKYRQEEAKAKLKAWEAQKSAQLSQAIINTALAVTSAIATGPPQGYILAALSAALGAIEIAKIESQTPPRFAKGVEFVKGPGTSTSDDVPARLSVGERVFSADKNKAFFPAFSAIHNDKVSADFANAMLAGKGIDMPSVSAYGNFQRPSIGKELAQKAVLMQIAGAQINEKSLARAIADAQWEDLDTLNDSVIASDRSNAAMLHAVNSQLSQLQTPLSLIYRK